MKNFLKCFQVKSIILLIISYQSLNNAMVLRNSTGNSIRIFGGNVAGRNQFPFQVGLFYEVSEGQAFCGGSLISANYILTAAHCCDDASEYTVVLGAFNIDDEEEEGQVTLDASGPIIHPDWNRKTMENDIAIIKLPQAIEFNDYIQPISLPHRSDESETYEGVEATTSGWGYYSSDEQQRSSVLRYVSNPVISNEDCSTEMLGFNIPDIDICMSGEGEKSICNGDSGGPFFIQSDEDDTVIQIGITSFNLKLGCDLDFPSVFARITKYFDFIQDNTDVIIT